MPAGTYFVRVRARNASGTSGASNEEVVTVQGPSGCAATSYILEAGSATRLSDLAATSTGSATPSFSATAVPNGTYYVRVRSVNATGRSAPTSEVSFTVEAQSSGGSPKASA